MTRSASETSPSVPLDAPAIPWYDGPYDIPVLIDDCKELGDFRMTRAIFFTIEASGAVDDLVSLLRAREVPFLLMGFTSILHRPSVDAARFSSPDEIDRLFDEIQRIEDVVVETGFVWLPNDVFGKPLPRRGDLYRVSYRLFRSALRFRQEKITLPELDEQAVELVRLYPDAIAASDVEAEVFRRWSRAQIEASRASYVRRKAGEGPPVLGRRDRKGGSR
ncbi:MAG: hypothetical protein R3195_07965 [Gemmatimonadota bacterium]|nr:hypothetical protein [Gemmatimonadota bacterium]